MRGVFTLTFLVLVCAPVLGRAQDSTEDRLRELLRRTAADLRAAQDGQAQLQASLDQEKQQNAALKKQIDDLLAAAAAKPAISKEQIDQMQSELQAAQAQVTALQTNLTQWQTAYNQAADLARAKDAESKTEGAHAAESQREAGVCSAANTKLITVANDILHLYQTQSFRSLLLSSYEPLLGLKKVELENLIQDYEDKIYDQKYVPKPVKVESQK